MNDIERLSLYCLPLSWRQTRFKFLTHQSRRSDVEHSRSRVRSLVPRLKTQLSLVSESLRRSTSLAWRPNPIEITSAHAMLREEASAHETGEEDIERLRNRQHDCDKNKTD